MNDKKTQDTYHRMVAYLADHEPRTAKVFAYMAARAEYEGKDHSLTLEWYEAHFWLGVRSFFNVNLDDDGNLLSDTENTAFWKQYQARKNDAKA